MKVTLMAATEFYGNVAAHCTNDVWNTDTDPDDAQGLIEFAGRACYQSWTKPNPDTATNKSYLANIIKQEHFSTFEHASATFYIEGVSRSFTHELIRHRHLSFSELSQRFVNVEDAAWVLPPAIDDDDHEKINMLLLAGHALKQAYKGLVAQLTAEGRTRKQAREAARAVMPNMTETRIVVTGNVRAWRHFIAMRATEHADAEMREVAKKIAWELKKLWSNLFQDMHLRVEKDVPNTVYFS